MRKKAVLVISFGSSYPEARKQTIAKIEEDIAVAFEEYFVYRAFTSPRIRQAIKQDGQIIYSVEEAMRHIVAEGVTDLMVQPTFMIRGKEYEKMYDYVVSFKKVFRSLVIGTPLLHTVEDYLSVAEAFKMSLGQIEKDEAVVCMGHGTDHFMSVSYMALDYVFKERIHSDIYMATLEAYPGLEQVVAQLKRKDYKKVRIVPFMLVAGHHAMKDMKGIGKESWENRLRQAGYEVECIMCGLGEIPEIRNIFVEHAKVAVKNIL